MQQQTDIGGFAIHTVVAGGTRHRIQRQDSAAEDVQEHLHIDMSAELDVARAPLDPLREPAPVIRRRPTDDPGRQDDAQRHATGQHVPFDLPEPVQRREGESRPPDQQCAGKDEEPVQPVAGRCRRHLLVRVAVHAPGRQHDVKGQQDGEYERRREEAGDGLDGRQLGHVPPVPRFPWVRVALCPNGTPLAVVRARSPNGMEHPAAMRDTAPVGVAEWTP